MASSALHSVVNKLAHPTSDSKSKKKKSPKTLEPPAAASKDSSTLNSPRNGPVDDAADGSGDSPHIREINKQIRNINKKLNSMTKVDAVLAENRGVPLDDLVANRKINTDQKAQALKKPQLQAQLSSLEAQLSVFRELDEAYSKKSSKDKEHLLAAHTKELEKVRAEAKAEADSEMTETIRNHLLKFSRFLAAAATRRNVGDDTGDEARAFEGALLLVYGGDVNAVEAAEKIINGSHEKVMSVDGQLTNVSFARVKELSLEGAPAEWTETSTTEPTSDPTLANASLTELEDPATADITNGTSRLAVDPQTAPPATSIDSDAANAAADSHWDPSKPGAQEDPLAESYEMVPRDPSEVENPPPAFGASGQQSWSDEVAAASEWADSAAASGLTEGNGGNNDGFHEVTHHRGGRRGGGGFRGGEYRGRGRGGRGFRGGDRGGRGRGGFRGRGRGE